MIQMSDVITWVILAVIAGVEFARFMIEKENNIAKRNKRRYEQNVAKAKPYPKTVYHSKDELLDTVLTAIRQAEHDKQRKVTVIVPSKLVTVRKAQALEKALSIGNYQVLKIEAYDGAGITCIDIQINGMY